MDSHSNPLTEPFLTEIINGDEEVIHLSIQENDVDIKESQQQVFLLMQQRKKTRRLHGSYARTSSIFAISFFIMTLIIILVNSYVISNQKTGVLKIKTKQLLPFILSITIALVLINMVAVSLLKELLTWLCLYIPLIFSIIYLSVVDDENNFIDNQIRLITQIAFLAVEGTVFLIGFIEIFIIPKVIESQWFKKKTFLMEKLWLVTYDGNWTVNYSNWTVNYRNSWMSCKRNICSYRGETNDKGMPHGQGFWLDDSNSGETLNGNWDNGRPVAPFTSTKNSTGSTSRALRLIFIMAGDDEFDQHKLDPTSDKPSRCGVASVECSVQGEFLRFLPVADISFGPYVLNDEATIAECCNKLRNLESPGTLSTVTVTIDNDRGLKIVNHEPEQIDSSNSLQPKRVVINVRDVELNEEHTLAHRKQTGSVPLAPPAWGIQNSELVSDGTVELEEHHNTSYLQIENWAPVTHKDALIIFPGFNSSVKVGLQMWGQFMAMTNLCNHVYPILFGWPNGKLASYWQASSKGAQSQEMKDKFSQLLDGIHDVGIRRVHFISHSMGVQPLLSIFEHKSDDSHSVAASRFLPSVGFEDERSEKDLLHCETITMLNADFPVDPFVDHAFMSIRQICSRITLVGDRNDTPLFFSHQMNAIAHFFGKKTPPLLLPKLVNSKKVSFATIGVNFDLMMDKIQETQESSDVTTETNSISDDGKPEVGKTYFKLPNASAFTHSTDRKRWLDIDVIDTTSLDTNIKGLRHSSFQMNPIMLKDLEELIVTGFRASQRITLVHRAGNIFSYSHAPSYLAM